MKNQSVNYSYINKSYLAILFSIIVFIAISIIGLSYINNKVTLNRYNTVYQGIGVNNQYALQILSEYNKAQSLDSIDDVSEYRQTVDTLGDKMQQLKDNYTQVMQNKNVRFTTASFIVLKEDSLVYSYYPHSNKHRVTQDIDASVLKQAKLGNVTYQQANKNRYSYYEKQYIFFYFYIGQAQNGDNLFIEAQLPK